MKLGAAPIERVPASARDLDLTEFTRCSELVYDDRGEDPMLRLRVCSPKAELVLLLHAVRVQRLPDLSPHLWLPVLEIVDISDRMLEGLRFLVESSDGEGLQCFCRSVECLSYEAL